MFPVNGHFYVSVWEIVQPNIEPTRSQISRDKNTMRDFIAGWVGFGSTKNKGFSRQREQWTKRRKSK